MEVSYRREAKHNYLVAGQLEGLAGYEARMLAGNRIRGLLRMHIRYQDGHPLYFYEITSRQPLNRLLENRAITRDEICQLMIQIHTALTDMEEYLLEGGGLLMEPQYIYVEPELFQTGLCLIPDLQGDFQEKLSQLLQYILKQVNHKDRECVVLAYSLYQESLKENCGMEDLLNLIAAERHKGMAEQRTEPRQKNLSECKTEYQGEQCVEYRAEDKAEHKVGQRAERKAGQRAERKAGQRAERKAGHKAENKAGQRAEHRVGQREEHKAEQKAECKAGQASYADSDSTGKWSLILIPQALLWLCVVVMFPAVWWLFRGKGAVLELRNLFIIVDGGLLVILIAINLWKFSGRISEDTSQIEDDPWRILYEDDEEEDQAYEPEKNTNELQEHDQTGMEEPFQTTLLSDRSQEEELHRLKALNDSEEDIVILYYPFVIGKHRDLADYVLFRDTVSRFHLRIDREDEHFTITDLNSTNGTRVKGHLLEANETMELELGDQVYIADAGYIFY